MSVFDYVVWIIAAVLLLPVLITPAGWLFAVALAVAWVVVAYGGRFVAQVEKERRQGERGMASQVRDRGGDR